MKIQTARGMSQADFHQWRQHPVTRWFLRYLSDYAEELGHGHTERWLQGQTVEKAEDEARGRVQTLDEMSRLGFDHIAMFYGFDQEAGNENTDKALAGAKAAR